MTQEEAREHNQQADAMVSGIEDISNSLDSVGEEIYRLRVVTGNANVMWLGALCVFFIMGCVFLWHVDYIGDRLHYTNGILNKLYARGISTAIEPMEIICEPYRYNDKILHCTTKVK